MIILPGNVENELHIVPDEIPETESLLGSTLNEGSWMAAWQRLKTEAQTVRENTRIFRDGNDQSAGKKLNSMKTN